MNPKKGIHYWRLTVFASNETMDWLPCLTQVRSKSITLVFFDQFSIKKGLDGGFWGSEIDWSQLQFENPIKNMKKMWKNYIFWLKKRCLKYPPSLGRRCWRWGRVRWSDSPKIISMDTKLKCIGFKVSKNCF